MTLEEKYNFLLEKNTKLREQLASWKRKAMDKKPKRRKVVCVKLFSVTFCRHSGKKRRGTLS